MRKRSALSSDSAERARLNRLIRRRIVRADLIRAVVLGLLMAACLLAAAYVSLSTGLWLAVMTFVVAMFTWRVTAKNRSTAVNEELTIPELETAFGQMHYTLDASLPEGEITALYPEGCHVRCSDRIDGMWKGFSFTFANVTIEGNGLLPMFHGQWLIVRTGWPDCVRVSIREQEEIRTPEFASLSTMPAIRDPEITERYDIQSDRAGDAETLLTDERLRAMLRSADGVRLMVEQGTLHLSLPSEEPFFRLSGQELTADEYAETTRRQIALICSWLDSAVKAEFR